MCTGGTDRKKENVGGMICWKKYLYFKMVFCVGKTYQQTVKKIKYEEKCMA